MAEIISRSLPLTNKKVIDILSLHRPWKGKILDLGCGEGYFSSILGEKLIEQECVLQEHMFACDLFPGEFKYDRISCDHCDFNLPFPYENNTFDAVCSIEVVEHLENIFHFSRELYRILKPGGVAIITTPNVMNINSRLKTFATGFPLLYGPLPISSQDPQDLGGHINPISYYYLVYSLKKAGFQNIRVHTDRIKRSAKLLANVFYLPIKLLEKIVFYNMKKADRRIYEENYDVISKINTLPLLLGRTVVLELVK
jgi:SAM-dependent methyltransferase